MAATGACVPCWGGLFAHRPRARACARLLLTPTTPLRRRGGYGDDPVDELEPEVRQATLLCQAAALPLPFRRGAVP